MEYKVSVIIPVYKVEKFVERCVRSLMEQTMDGIEYIFVDDASPDDSILILHKVLVDYPERSEHVKILVHSENKGLPAARVVRKRILFGVIIMSLTLTMNVICGSLLMIHRKLL